MKSINNSCILQSYIIPDDIEEIPDEFFKDCVRLRYVSMPNTVKVIGRSSFNGCRSLKDLKLSDELKEIKEYAFKDCEKLQTIIIPESVEIISESAFINCESLNEINMYKSTFNKLNWNISKHPNIKIIDELSKSEISKSEISKSESSKHNSEISELIDKAKILHVKLVQNARMTIIKPSLETYSKDQLIELIKVYETLYDNFIKVNEFIFKNNIDSNYVNLFDNCDTYM